MRYDREGISSRREIYSFDQNTNTYIFYRELPQPEAIPLGRRNRFKQLYSLQTPGIKKAIVWGYYTQASQEGQPSLTQVLRLTLGQAIPRLGCLWPLTDFNSDIVLKSPYKGQLRIPQSYFPRNPLQPELVQNGLTKVTIEVPFTDTSNIPLMAPTPVTAIYITINRPPAPNQLWQLVRRVKRALGIDSIPEFVTFTLRPEPLNTQESQTQWPQLQATRSGLQLILPEHYKYFQLYIATDSIGPFYMGHAKYMPKAGVTMWGVT